MTRTSYEGYQNRQTMESDYLKTISTLLDQIRASTNVTPERKVQLTQDLLDRKIGLSQVRLALGIDILLGMDRPYKPYKYNPRIQIIEDGKKVWIKSTNEMAESNPYVADAMQYDDSPIFHRDDDDKTDVDLVYRDVIYHEDPKNFEEISMIQVKNKDGKLVAMPWSNAVRTTPLYNESGSATSVNYVPSYTDSILLSRATTRVR